MRLAITLVLAFVPSLAAAEGGFAPRSVDMSAGLTYGAPPHPALDALPGGELQVRVFPTPHFWLGMGGAFEPNVDFRNPESGETVPLLAGGVGAGAYVDLGDAFTLFAGGRLEALRVWNLPEEGDHTGLRGSATASLAMLLGEVFGHPMAIELRAERQRLFVDGGRDATWRAGVFLTGVLFPDRPLR